MGHNLLDIQRYTQKKYFLNRNQRKKRIRIIKGLKHLIRILSHKAPKLNKKNQDSLVRLRCASINLYVLYSRTQSLTFLADNAT